MPKINLLKKNVAELIAAGEVVERPASVIKELVENSVDAGACRITVEIQRGGISFIRVSDNGCGISREDVETAFLRHATSKILTENDLDCIATLGFRGEALASISAVSRVEMLTRTKDETIGTRYEIAGGEGTAPEDAGCPEGTTIVVRDLFYNTPARMKFLKKDAYEGITVAAIMDKIALSHPEIAFKFIKDGKCTMQTPGNGDLKATVYAVCGKEFCDSLTPAEGELGGIGVSGYVSRPSACRNNRNGIFVFLNGRYIFSKTVISALDRAYENSLMVGRYPAAVLNLNVPPQTVDVNVHPTKIEVRFSDEKRIWDAVYFTAKNAITGGDTRKKANLSAAQNRMSVEQYRQLTVDENTAPKKPQPPIHSGPAAFSAHSSGTSKPAAQQRSTETPETYKKVLNAMKESFKQAEKLDVKVDFSDSQAASGPTKTAEYVGVNKPISQPEPPKAEPKAPLGAAVPKTEPEAKIEPAPQTEPLTEEPTAAPKITAPATEYIGEAFSTYIIAKKGNSLYLIDKHAAHERVIFNRLMKEAKTETQLLLIPQMVELTKEDFAVILDWIPELTKAGFEIEEFGDSQIIVRSVPAVLTGCDIKGAILEIIENITSRRQITTEKLDWLYHSIACRAAVKAGNLSSPQELKAFAEKILENNDIMYCPHGRPVAIELTRREIEKQFGRIQ